MGVIVLPRECSSQPQQMVSINWRNPIAQALAFAAIPVGGTLVDMVTGNIGSPTGSSKPTFAASTLGAGCKFTSGAAANSYMNFGSKIATQDIHLGRSTWFFVANQTSIGGFAERSDGDSAIGWIFGTTISSNKLQFRRVYSAVDFATQSTSAITLSTNNSFAVTYDGVGTSSGVSLYVGGASVASSTTSSGAGTSASDSAQSLYLGRDSSAGAMGGIISLGLIFRRVLAASEILSLHNNPYQLFCAVKGKMLIKTAAVGGGGAGGSAQMIYIINC